jgi:long-subunit fatty acid transport protein
VVSELGINANYAFTKNIALTVGYQLLHLSAVALTAQQNSVQSVVYQGGRLGVTIAF